MKKFMPLFAMIAFLLSCQSIPPAQTGADESAIPRQKQSWEKDLAKDSDKKTLAMIVITPDAFLHILKIDGVKQYGAFSDGLSGNVLLKPGLREITYAYDEFVPGTSTEYHAVRTLSFEFQEGLAYKVTCKPVLGHFSFDISYEVLSFIE